MKGQRAYTRATRMAATFLAKLNGAEAAATAFGIDPRTVRGWLGTVEVADDQWTAIRDVLLARGAEMAALGKTAGLPAILTGAGISDRNVRYGQLIARREAGRAGETCDCVLPPGWVKELHPKPDTPEHAQAVWAIAASKMSDNRRHFMYALHPLIALYIDHKDEGGTHTQWDIPEVREATAAALAGVQADGMAGLIKWVESLDDETLAARQTLVDSAFDAYREALQGELRRRRDDEATDTTPSPDPSPENVEAPTPITEPTPLPTARVERPRAVPMVLDISRPEPWYDLDTGERRRRSY